MSASVGSGVGRPKVFAARLALAVVVLTIAGICALLVAAGAGQDEFELHPWWELPSLGVLLLAPYVIALCGFFLKDRDPAAGGLALIVAGVTSMVPAYLLLTVLVGMELLVLGVVLVVLGLRTIWLGRRRPSLPSALAAIAAIILVFAAAPARLVGDQSRCLHWTRYADGHEVREEYRCQPENGRITLSPAPGGGDIVSSGATSTSDYISAAKAGSSALLALGGVLLALALPVIEPRSPKRAP